MFNISSRRYTGAKTKLLDSIDYTLKQGFDYTKYNDLSFFDVFGGTGVVGEYFLKNPYFNHFIINDFLHSNYVIYQGFFKQEAFSKDTLEKLVNAFNAIDSKEQNYYSLNFGDKFFSLKDSIKIGTIREEIENLKESKKINTKEYYILLSSLLYSLDKVANTVGHYDAYRKNIALKDKFIFELIRPITTKSKVEIFKEDSNKLVKDFIKEKRKIDVAFIDPPYNSRQYSRFYHLLETITLNDKPKLYGITLKREPENMSEYCKVEAESVFRELCEDLSKIARFFVVTYNNTNSANVRSNTKISLETIQAILESFGKPISYKIPYKAFNSGKTNFKNHMEYIFVCKIFNF
ncbi:DNA methyltransferase [Campylobacter jejuni]|nr:DNA methyltransferase [Campylobacter jejuni]ELJ4341058.1 DNA adenine methylase [Campylobacter jejuni]